MAVVLETAASAVRPIILLENVLPPVAPERAISAPRLTISPVNAPQAAVLHVAVTIVSWYIM
jgi:hypothetical protein